MERGGAATRSAAPLLHAESAPPVFRRRGGAGGRSSSSEVAPRRRTPRGGLERIDEPVDDELHHFRLVPREVAVRGVLHEHVAGGRPLRLQGFVEVAALLGAHEPVLRAVEDQERGFVPVDVPERARVPRLRGVGVNGRTRELAEGRTVNEQRFGDGGRRMDFVVGEAFADRKKVGDAVDRDGRLDVGRHVRPVPLVEVLLAVRGAEHLREVAAGGVAQNADALGVDPVLLGVGAQVPDRTLPVDDGRGVDVGNDAVFGRRDHEPGFGQSRAHLGELLMVGRGEAAPGEVDDRGLLFLRARRHHRHAELPDCTVALDLGIDDPGDRVDLRARDVDLDHFGAVDVAGETVGGRGGDGRSGDGRNERRDGKAAEGEGAAGLGDGHGGVLR